MTIGDYVLYIALAVGVLLVARSIIGARWSGGHDDAISPVEAGDKRRQAFMKTVALGTAAFAFAIIAAVVFVFYGLPLILERMTF